MAFNGLPYTPLIVKLFFYSPQQAFDSSTKGLREEGQNNIKVGTEHKQQKNGKRKKGWTNDEMQETQMKDGKIRYRQEKDVKLRKNLCIRNITKTTKLLLVRKMAFLKEINSITKKREGEMYMQVHTLLLSLACH